MVTSLVLFVRKTEDDTNKLTQELCCIDIMNITPCGVDAAKNDEIIGDET